MVVRVSSRRISGTSSLRPPLDPMDDEEDGPPPTLARLAVLPRRSIRILFLLLFIGVERALRLPVHAPEGHR